MSVCLSVVCVSVCMCVCMCMRVSVCVLSEEHDMRKYSVNFSLSHCANCIVLRRRGRSGRRMQQVKFGSAAVEGKVTRRGKWGGWVAGLSLALKQDGILELMKARYRAALALPRI